MSVMSAAVFDPLTEDLEQALLRLEDDWERFRGASLFMTGGTGLFGRWLLEALTYANRLRGLDLEITVLSRNPQGFAARARHLASDPAVTLLAGDVRDFVFPDRSYDLLIHGAATSAEETFRGERPLAKFDTLVHGTRHVLDFAVRADVGRLLFLSSGSAYGASGLERTPETYAGAPDTTNPDSALGEAKRAAELLVTCYAREHGLECVIARCFSFVGPFLPLDIHYAIGNFIRHALWDDAVTIQGDGTQERSYLYMADLVVWLLALLDRGQKGRIYNVGSDRGIAIRDLADLVRSVVAPGKPVVVLGLASGSVGNEVRNRYVPDITRAREELGLDVWTDLETAIGRTAASVLLTVRI